MLVYLYKERVATSPTSWLMCCPQRLMTPEALEFVRLASVQTVKGWEDRAHLQEFRHACTLAGTCLRTGYGRRVESVC